MFTRTRIAFLVFLISTAFGRAQQQGPERSDLTGMKNKVKADYVYKPPPRPKKQVFKPPAKAKKKEAVNTDPSPFPLVVDLWGVNFLTGKFSHRWYLTLTYFQVSEILILLAFTGRMLYLWYLSAQDSGPVDLGISRRPEPLLSELEISDGKIKKYLSKKFTQLLRRLLSARKRKLLRLKDYIALRLNQIYDFRICNFDLEKALSCTTNEVTFNLQGRNFASIVDCVSRIVVELSTLTTTELKFSYKGVQTSSAHLIFPSLADWQMPKLPLLDYIELWSASERFCSQFKKIHLNQTLGSDFYVVSQEVGSKEKIVTIRISINPQTRSVVGPRRNEILQEHIEVVEQSLQKEFEHYLHACNLTGSFGGTVERMAETVVITLEKKWGKLNEQRETLHYRQHWYKFHWNRPKGPGASTKLQNADRRKSATY